MSTENPILTARATSVLINRQDEPGQVAWTEWRVGIAYGCPANPGDLVGLGANGTIDPCLLPSTTGLLIEVSGTPVDNQNVLNFIPGSGITIVSDPSGGLTISATGSPSDCGSAAYLCTDEMGIEVEVDLSHPTHPGQLLISQPGNTTAIWADPLVQGLYPAGSSISSPPAYSPPTTIQPVLIGGEDCNGVLQNIAVTTGGVIVSISQDQETDVNVLRFGATTGLTLASNITNTLVPLLSIQPKAGATSVTFTFRSLQGVSMGNVTHFQFLKNAVLTGAAFANVNPASFMTYDLTATSYTGGTLVDSSFVGADSKRADFEFHFGFTGGTPDTLTVVFAPVIGNSKSNAGCSMAWDEQSTCL